MTVNIITGSPIGESIVGTPQADWIIASDGNDTITAGVGNDMLTYSAQSAPIHVTVTGYREFTIFAADGTDIAREVGRITGTSGGDRFTAPDGYLRGLGGNDLFEAVGHTRVFFNHTLDGGAGFDIVSYADAKTIVYADLGNGPCPCLNADPSNRGALSLIFRATHPKRMRMSSLTSKD